jgi:eukaryotic-like serine/threonine-protein kinase
MLNPGTKIGPYEILSPLGAGGMGEVYRARDAKLGRDVAIKVLPSTFAADPDRVARFEREAKAVAALSHPNILAIFDFGEEGDTAYAVTELLEGETLRDRLEAGPLPVRKALEVAVQIARGLGAAHDKGIVHRDLKPENLFLTKDGHVKILDFGLARVGGPSPSDSGKTMTTPPEGVTGPGVVLGTVGYMSPEQVRGSAADHRSDLFSLGAILYEMVSGRRAFKRDTAAESMTAILKEEPPEFQAVGKAIPQSMDRVVRRCLEKSPEERFQSARDLAFALEDLSPSSSGGVPITAPFAPKHLKVTLLWAALGALVVLGAAVAGWHLGKRVISGSVTFQPLSYRPAPIFNARFGPDGKTVYYSAAPEGNSPEIFSVQPGSPGATSLGLHTAHLLSVSSRGELAVLTHATYRGHSFFEGTLARMPLDGGGPREILEGVREADWSPDGKDLAVIRSVNGLDRLEFPVGKVLCQVGGYLSDLRFSPRGDKIAFFEHPIRWDDRGLVAVVDMAGKKTILSEGYWGEEGLTWSPTGDEVLFSAGMAYNNFKVYAVDLSGKRREALGSAGGLTIHDTTQDGRWLVTRDDHTFEMPVLAPGQQEERDLSWLDFSQPFAFSSDGRTLLFSEEGGILGINYAACLRRTDGSPVVRLGEGDAADLSPDGKWALAVIPTSPQQLMLYPTGAGELRKLDRGPLVTYDSAEFFPDGQRVLICGHEDGQPDRCYVQDLAGGAPRAVTPPGTRQALLSPDAQTILARQNEGALQLYSMDGRPPRTVPGAKPDDTVIRWRADGRSLLTYPRLVVPARIERLDLQTGTRTPVQTLGPQKLAGVLAIGRIIMTEDEKSYAYYTSTMISHLFLVEGAR